MYLFSIFSLLFFYGLITYIHGVSIRNVSYIVILRLIRSVLLYRKGDNTSHPDPQRTDSIVTY